MRIAERALGGRDRIRTVLELGARDCEETLAFSRALPQARVHAFECNPATLPECRRKVAGNPRINLVEQAVSDREGVISFFPIDPDRTRTTWEDGNPGASSLFRASGKYPVETYVQREIEVPTTSLRAFLAAQGIDRVDLMWMDIQGAELLALRGLGPRIRDVALIHLEVEFLDIYEGQPLFGEVKSFLNANGFLLHAFTTMGEFAADAVFVNKGLLPARDRPGALLHDRSLLYRARSLPGHVERARASRPVRLARRAAPPAARRHYTRYRDFARLDVARTGSAALTARRALELGWLELGKPLLGADVNQRRQVPAGRPLSVLVPAAGRDVDVLDAVLASLRANLAHPVKGIHLVTDDTSGLRALAGRHGCMLVDEEAVAPLPRSGIDYTVDGVDRSGWLLQQLVKLRADEITGDDRVLVWDADTVAARRQAFTAGHRTVFDASDEYHRAYDVALQRLLGHGRASRLSFVAHHMLFEADVLRRLRADLEARSGLPWYEAVLAAVVRDDASGFSEYELYGNYFLRSRPREALRTYWFNAAAPRAEADRVQEALARLGPRAKTLSFHHYHSAPVPETATETAPE
nr:FkbM family methyltransferase [Motilibacter aurantiacus]